MYDVLAVDADIVAYRCAAVTNDMSEVKANIDSTLRNIRNNSGIYKMRLYLSGDDNFRKQIAVTRGYKENRTQEKPLLLGAARNYIVLEYGGVVVHGYEADDAIASDMEQNKAVHCGVDKDLLQVEGKHYNYVKDLFVDVRRSKAVYNLYKQVMVGDASDNIPGLPGYGEKKAGDILKDCEDSPTKCADLTLEAFRSVMGDNWNEYYEEQYKLVYLVRDLDILDMVTRNFAGDLF